MIKLDLILTVTVVILVTIALGSAVGATQFGALMRASGPVQLNDVRREKNLTAEQVKQQEEVVQKLAGRSGNSDVKLRTRLECESDLIRCEQVCVNETAYNVEQCRDDCAAAHDFCLGHAEDR